MGYKGVLDDNHGKGILLRDCDEILIHATNTPWAVGSTGHITTSLPLNPYLSSDKRNSAKDNFFAKVVLPFWTTALSFSILFIRR